MDFKNSSTRFYTRLIVSSLYKFYPATNFTRNFTIIYLLCINSIYNIFQNVINFKHEPQFENKNMKFCIFLFLEFPNFSNFKAILLFICPKNYHQRHLPNFYFMLLIFLFRCFLVIT